MKPSGKRRFYFDDKIFVARKLWRLQQAKRIPCVWIEDGAIYIQVDFDRRRIITWTAASRIVYGEPLMDVVMPTTWLEEFVSKQKAKRKVA